MSTHDDKTIAWQGRIQERAAHATKAILDRLATMPKSGLNNLAPTERRDLSETIAKQIVDTMSTLGTFVTAGAQDFQVCHLEGVNIGKGGKVAMKLIPLATESGAINLQLLAANADKQVVVAMVNGLAYSQAREALSKAITREQTDWVQRSHDADAAEQETSAELQAENEGRQDAPGQPAVESDRAPTPSDSQLLGEYFPPDQQPTSDLIAEQPGDGDGEQASETEGGESVAPAADSSGSGDGSSGSIGDDAGPAGRAAEDAGAQSAEGAATNPDSPLARAGRRVRRRPGGERPTAH